MPQQIKASSGGARFYRSLEKLFIRTRLRSRWNRNFSKAGSSGALISLTFSVVISGPRRQPRSTGENKKGRRRSHVSAEQHFPRNALFQQYVTPSPTRRGPSFARLRATLGEPAPTVHSTWAGEMQDGSTCGRHAGRGNYSSGSCITSSMSEVLNVIYSGSSCWEEALKWV